MSCEESANSCIYSSPPTYAIIVFPNSLGQGLFLCSKCPALFENRVAVKIVQLGFVLCSKCPALLSPKQFELSYYSNFPPSYTIVIV